MTLPECQWHLSWRQEQERRDLRRRAWFVGALMIASLIIEEAVTWFLKAPLQRAMVDMDVSPAAAWTYYGLYALLYLVDLVAAPLILAAIFHLRPVQPAENRPPVKRGHLWLLAACGMGVCMLAQFLSGYWQEFVQNFGFQPYQGELPFGVGWEELPRQLLFFAVLPGVVEELVFRGWILGALRPFGERRALLLSALLFGLAHGNLTQFLFTAILGLTFGYLFLRTGRLWPGMCLHFANNAMAVVLGYLEERALLPEDVLLAVQVATLCLLGLLGAFAAVCLRQRRDTRDLLRPLTDHRSAVTAAERSRMMWFNPAVIISVALMVLATVEMEAFAAVAEKLL